MIEELTGKDMDDRLDILSRFTPLDIKMNEIFFPHAAKRQLAAIDSNQRFVHYCDASAAMSIIQNKQVWMRNATWMNDPGEIKYGIDRLVQAAKSPDGERLRDVLNAVWPNFVSHFDDVFLSWLDDFQNETYITCFTEQLEDEEVIGRLSMWRAYGRERAVAFVVNGGPILRPSAAIAARSSPVAYASETRFLAEFKNLVDQIAENRELLAGLPEETTFNNLFAAFRYAVICTKHPAFHEEREWRVVYQPNFQASDRLIEDTVVLAGVPQRIFKIPLKDYPSEGFYGAEMPEFLHRLIIGPGIGADAVRREFVRLLESAGVEDADTKVIVSDVPLRA